MSMSMFNLIPPDLLGTIPGWITSIGIGTIVVTLLRRDVQIKGQKATAEEAIRDHYAEELTALRAQRAEDLRVAILQREEDSKRWKEALEHSEAQHDICLKDRDTLRTRLRKVEDDLEGLYRTLIATSADRVIEMGDAIPPHIREVARKTLKAQRTKP